MRLHPGRFLRAGAVCAAALPPWGNPGTLCARPLPSLDVPRKAHPPSGTRRAEEPAYRMGAAKGICPSFREPLPLLPLIVAASCERVCVFSWTTPQSKPLWPLRGILTRVTALGWGVLWPFYLFCHLQPVPWGKQLPGTQEPPQHCCPPARLQPRTASPPGARSCVCLCHTALLTAAPTWESSPFRSLTWRLQTEGGLVWERGSPGEAPRTAQEEKEEARASGKAGAAQTPDAASSQQVEGALAASAANPAPGCGMPSPTKLPRPDLRKQPRQGPGWVRP